MQGTLLSGCPGADLSSISLTKGGGWRGRQVIWRSQNWSWQDFKVWHLLSQPGICAYFLSSSCFKGSVNI